MAGALGFPFRPGLPGVKTHQPTLFAPTQTKQFVRSKYAELKPQLSGKVFQNVLAGAQGLEP